MSRCMRNSRLEPCLCVLVVSVMGGYCITVPRAKIGIGVGVWRAGSACVVLVLKGAESRGNRRYRDGARQGRVD
jgi:hypothetical protein